MLDHWLSIMLHCQQAFLAYFWPRPASISTAMPRHQENTELPSTHQGLLPVRSWIWVSSSCAVFLHYPNRLYSLKALLLVLLPCPKACNTPSSFILYKQFYGPQQSFRTRYFEIKKTQKLQQSVTATVQYITASRRPTAQVPREVDVTRLATWFQGQKTVPSPVLFCVIDRVFMADTQGWRVGRNQMHFYSLCLQVRQGLPQPCYGRWNDSGEKQLMHIHAGCHDPKMNKQFLQGGLSSTWTGHISWIPKEERWQQKSGGRRAWEERAICPPCHRAS